MLRLARGIAFGIGLISLMAGTLMIWWWTDAGTAEEDALLPTGGTVAIMLGVFALLFFGRRGLVIGLSVTGVFAIGYGFLAWWDEDSPDTSSMQRLVWIGVGLLALGMCATWVLRPYTHKPNLSAQQAPEPSREAAAGRSVTDGPANHDQPVIAYTASSPQVNPSSTSTLRGPFWDRHAGLQRVVESVVAGLVVAGAIAVISRLT